MVENSPRSTCTRWLVMRNVIDWLLIQRTR